MPGFKTTSEKAKILGNRKKDLNPVRGKQKIIDPERGPQNK
ncbi:hypothetical protein ACOBQJ_04400 [Pelotomaculum propionicicum]